jgi:hypothetical protein
MSPILLIIHLERIIGRQMPSNVSPGLQSMGIEWIVLEQAAAKSSSRTTYLKIISSYPLLSVGITFFQPAEEKA